MNKLIVIDGNSIANRAFYALPLLSNAQGQHTNAVYGFTTMLMKLIEEEKPTHFLVAFDAGKVTFRHKDYKEYKGGRAKTPPELSEQFPMIKQLLEAFAIQQFELEGYEADDIVGTITKMADEQQFPVLVVTGDKDMLQLASQHVTIALTRKGISEMEKYDPEAIKEKYGLTPQQIVDLKGLMGDSSDNIPGIPGVGEKTGLKLLHEYGTVEEVLAHADDLKGKMKEKVKEHAESARMSKELATIFREVPLDFGWESLKYEGYEAASLAEMFTRLEFKSLLEKMNLSTARGEIKEEEVSLITIGPGQLGQLGEILPRIQSIHVEVTGENPHQGAILGIGLAGEDACYFISIDTLKQEAAQPLVKWLEDEAKEKVIYDAHKAQLALHWQGIELRGIRFDVLLAGYLLDPTKNDQTLSGMTDQYGVPAIQSDEHVFGKGAKFKVPEIEVLSEHLCRKALAVHRLQPVMQKHLNELQMDELFYDLELPLSSVLASMELRGVKVDVQELKDFGEELQKKLDEVISHIYELAGTEFNLNSPKQLGEILFDKLGLPVIKKTKTGYSTDAEVLEKLEPYHEIISHILYYRTISKLQSTYVEGLLKEVHTDTGKIHTYYRQTIAATGRLSSQFPNLQNIPIRLEEGRKIRKVFKPSEEGWRILAADYSQIELRILAHISKDEKLIEAFREDRDIHTKTAMDVFGVSAEQVDSEMRRRAKAVNFGIVYGISDYGLSQNLNITRKEAAAFIEQYFAVFQGVRAFMDDIVKQAKKDGYVSTLLHRRRYLPEINASNFNQRSFAERTAMNTPIQGTAADVIKLAMVQLYNRMQKEKVQSRMLLQVHDELVLEVPPNEMDLMERMVRETMENALELAVPLKVEVSSGKDWYEAK
ncbi:DNA polymerase I [Marinicrinis lubricantis]|uniref:DNA polymerase I n=1 Tax=Marinicrinis lubricantis TaxID=2086470 RepID=A0ABW1IJ67_9BACL